MLQKKSPIIVNICNLEGPIRKAVEDTSLRGPPPAGGAGRGGAGSVPHAAQERTCRTCLPQPTREQPAGSRARLSSPSNTPKSETHDCYAPAWRAGGAGHHGLPAARGAGASLPPMGPDGAASLAGLQGSQVGGCRAGTLRCAG